MARDRSAPADARARFGPTAERYVGSSYHAQGADLAKVVEAARLSGRERVLDAGAGGGHTALRCAPRAASVVAYDLTRPMLHAARQHLTASGATNVDYCEGAAGALPFAGGAFDVVTCRQAAHHFPNVAAFCGEAARVLTRGGRLVIVDTVGHADPDYDSFVEDIERRRDPSHVEDLTIDEWTAVLTASGFAVVASEPFRVLLEFEDWTERQRVPEAERAALARDMLAAPEPIRQHYAIEPGGRHGVATFEIDCAIITAESVS